MATVSYTKDTSLDNFAVYTWTPLTETNADGKALLTPGRGDHTFQVTGDFGTGGAVTIQGSVDGENWVALNDAGGAAISLGSGGGLVSVLEAPPYMRPFVSAGTGVSVTAILAIRGR